MMHHPDAGPSARGELKLYIGSAAGVGKTMRMLHEAHEMRRRGIDVVVGYVETHGRAETAAAIGDLEVVPRLQVPYRGVTLEEMDLGAVLQRRPAVAVVDELAHTNVPGLRHAKRWEDVLYLLHRGISVLSAVNVQHLESLNHVIERTLGVSVRETVPDWVVAQAGEVVNIDIAAEDLRQRLREGKVYAREKVPQALSNFFTEENLSTLRELALREVASSVDRARQENVRRESGSPLPKTVDRLLVAMSSNLLLTKALLRKASRLAGQLSSDWYCVHVQVPEERADRIDASVQRGLVENIQLAQSLGAEFVKLEASDVASAIARFAHERGVTLIVMGQSQRGRLQRLWRPTVMEALIAERKGLDVFVVSLDDAPSAARAR
jgi:two-component system, OmpR family, sensor histidine kinase KdpD